MTEPVWPCAARNRGFMQWNDAVSTSSENGVIKGRGGLNVASAE
jgi:hypothetical protein